MPQHAAPPLSAAEAATVFRFDAAPDADESLRRRVAEAINDRGAWCGECQDGDADACRMCLKDCLGYADAAIAVVRGEA